VFDHGLPQEVVLSEVWLIKLEEVEMARKRYKPEEIVAKLRQWSADIAGKSAAEAIR